VLRLWEHYIDISLLDSVTCVRDEEGNVTVLRPAKGEGT
jgi:hypothetical protein